MTPDQVADLDSRFLTTLIEINHEITSILDLDELLRKIAELTHRVVHYQIFALFLMDEERQELYFRLAVGHSADIVENLRIPVGDGLVGTAAMTRRPVVVDDVRNDPRYIEAVKAARSEVAVPLISKNKVVGVLDIESPEVGYFSEEHVRLLSLLASQIAIAIENAKLYESERSNRDMLSLLYDVSKDLGSTLEVDELVHNIAAAVKTTINYQIFSIFMLDERQQLLRPRIVVRDNVREHHKMGIPLGTGIIGTSAQKREALRVGDVTTDPRYLAVHSETRSEMAVPLVYKGRVIGIIDLESPELDYFTEYHERFLVTLATRIATALVNAELYERVSENERRMDREMKIAREIQLQLMPEELPMLTPMTVAVLFTPVAHLGGDLYDFIPFDDKRLAIVLGDVAGKGAPAALYGALSSGMIRTRAGRKYPPGQMLQLVNKTLSLRPIESHYIALTYSIYDPTTRKITMANSGLPYPLLVRNGAARYLDLSGIPLGLFPDSTYQEMELQLETGDVLVFYSDGVIEMRNDAGDDFGMKRLSEVTRANASLSASELITVINQAVDDFAGRASPGDDRTMIVVKMQAE